MPLSKRLNIIRFKISGFTLVEMVGVLMVVGILAVFVAPRLNTTTFAGRSAADRAQSMLRYAQKVAIAQNRNIFVIFDANGGSVCFNQNCTSRVMAPTNTPVTLGLPSGIGGGINPLITGFYFNGLGRPFALTDNGINSSFVRTTITLQADGTTWQVVVEAETGYVHS